MRNFGSILLGFWISSLNFALAETESALFSQQVVESCLAVAELWTVDSAPARKQKKKKIRGMAIADRRLFPESEIQSVQYVCQDLFLTIA